MNTQAGRVREAFAAALGRPPTHVVQAPGRVNLIGEHTDYNDGFVLPCAIDFRMLVAASARSDGLVRVLAADYGGEQDQFDLGAPITPRADRHWPNYVRGTVRCLQERGLAPGGADLVVSGDIPQGAGLSSSAALEVVVAQTFKELYRLDLGRVEIARIGQQAENEFVGCRCGVMDQMISVCGLEDHAQLIDCRSLECRAVRIPDELAVVIINSNKSRGLVESEYNTRRHQCEAAARHFGVAALRDVSIEQFDAQRRGLEDAVARRARHIITENERVLRATEALAAGNMPAMSRLMAESHASMRDDFEISAREVDILVDIVQGVLGESGGVRMTGGGFGGCVVALVPHDLVDEVSNEVGRSYSARTGLRESVFVCRASQGAGLVDRS